MKIQLSELRSLSFWVAKKDSKITERVLWLTGWDYWFIRIPFTRIIIHYEKLPF